MRDAIESAHMGHPDFRAGGRIFATLHSDMKFAMVKLTPEQQEIFVRENPSIFEPESGAWGRQGCTRVRLECADEDTLGEAMTLAWRNATRKRPAAPKTPATRNRRTKSGGGSRIRP
jgi:hypothetical protein